MCSRSDVTVSFLRKIEKIYIYRERAWGVDIQNVDACFYHRALLNNNNITLVFVFYVRPNLLHRHLQLNKNNFEKTGFHAKHLTNFERFQRYYDYLQVQIPCNRLVDTTRDVFRRDQGVWAQSDDSGKHVNFN